MICQKTIVLIDGHPSFLEQKEICLRRGKISYTKKEREAVREDLTCFDSDAANDFSSRNQSQRRNAGSFYWKTLSQ